MNYIWKISDSSCDLDCCKNIFDYRELFSTRFKLFYLEIWNIIELFRYFLRFRLSQKYFQSPKFPLFFSIWVKKNIRDCYIFRTNFEIVESFDTFHDLNCYKIFWIINYLSRFRFKNLKHLKCRIEYFVIYDLNYSTNIFNCWNSYYFL